MCSLEFVLGNLDGRINASDMMNRELLMGFCGEAEALSIYEEVRRSDNFVGFARQFMHDEDYRVARNALWSLTKATDSELSCLQPLLNELIDLAMSAQNSSVRRLSLNVIERLNFREEDLRTDFLDFCLARMVSLEEYPGVQSLAMKLAYRMCRFYPELMDELHRTLRDMDMEYYRPAVKSVRNRILRGQLRG